MSFEIGETVGDYQIIALLGRGGMGKVFKVRNTISDRIEAMKVLLSDAGELPDLVERFIREIKVVASLEHPHIAALRTALRLRNQLIMIMEFVEGSSLEENLRSNHIEIWRGVNYIGQVLSALSYAHRGRRGASGYQTFEHPRQWAGCRQADRFRHRQQGRRSALDGYGHGAGLALLHVARTSENGAARRSVGSLRRRPGAL